MKHTTINPPPVAICPTCGAEFVGSANPPGWDKVTISGAAVLVCGDCVSLTKWNAQERAAKRARARKGGAA